jgi:hypothetical protein
MSRQPKENPDFPAGATVRVRKMMLTSTPARQHLTGQIGIVIRSSGDTILVEFPGVKQVEQFQPQHLDRVADPPPG